MITRQQQANSPAIQAKQHQVPAPVIRTEPEEPEYRMHKFQIAV